MTKAVGSMSIGCNKHLGFVLNFILKLFDPSHIS